MHTYISYFLYPSPIDGELGGLFNLTHEYGCNKHVCASRHVCVAMLTYSFASIHRRVQLSYGSSTFTLFLRTLHIDFLIYLSIFTCWPQCLCVGQRATRGRRLSPSTMWSRGPSSGPQSLWEGPADSSAIYSRGWRAAPPDAISQVLGSCATPSVSISAGNQTQNFLR